MKTIWKFNVEPQEKFAIKMPLYSEILCVQVQNEAPCIWALVDTDSELEERYFEIFGTGIEMKSDMGVQRHYIGTYQIEWFVGHLFERIN